MLNVGHLNKGRGSQMMISKAVISGGTVFLMVAGLVAAAETSASASGAAAVVAPSPAGLADPSIPTLPQPHCLPGQTALHAAAAGKTADGGFVYEFVIAGKVNRVPVPPSSFTPATASAAQLAEYGFPPQPANLTARTEWVHQFSNFKRVPLPALCLADHANEPNRGKGRAAPTLHHPAATSQQSTPGTPIADTWTSGNWAGTVVDNGDQYVATQGDWPQSYAVDCGCGTSDTDESTWTGLGGWNSSSLLQEGTDMQGTPSNIFPWYEYLHQCPADNPSCNPPEIPINSLPVGGGMDVHTYTAYQASTGQTNFLVCAGGNCQSVIAYLDGSYYDGSSAEWIYERPCYGQPDGSCYNKPITNFEYNNWTGSAQNTAQNWVGLNDVGGYGVSMVNGNNQTLVAPTAYTSGSTYTDTWFQAQ